MINIVISYRFESAYLFVSSPAVVLFQYTGAHNTSKCSLQNFERNGLGLTVCEKNLLQRVLFYRNISMLPLAFNLRSSSPFVVTPDEAYLKPGEIVCSQVTFDPSFRADYESAVAKNRLTITYIDNSKKDGIDLLGEIHRPNLRFDTSKVEFGSVLTDTNRRLVLNVTNCSSLDVVYHWTFFDDDSGEMGKITSGVASPPLNDGAQSQSHRNC